MRTDPIIEAASEVDRLRGQVAHLQDALDAIERAVGFVPKDEPLTVWVERVAKERDDLRQASNAALRILYGQVGNPTPSILRLRDAINELEAI